VIFVAGVVTGGLLVSYSDRAQQKQHRPSPREIAKRRSDNKQAAAGSRDPSLRGSPASPKMSASMPKVLRLDFLQNLDRELRLTDDQRHQIEEIISEGQEHNRQLWTRALPEMRREIQKTKERIREVLDSEQLKRFEELMRQRPQRKNDQPMLQPDRRLRLPLPPRGGLPPESAPQPRPPAESPANP
jgi:hypothetical protein